MDRIIDSNLQENDVDLLLRPQKLKEYIGQKTLKENLQVFIGAALKRNECLDHVLLYGPPGLGKTTLAMIIANELGTKIHITSGTVIEKPGDLLGLLNELEPGDVLFIDEIHRIPKIVEESLYTAMEDFEFSIILSRENDVKSLKVKLPPFTLIGATTRAGDLSSPLRERFGIIEKINFYKIEELKEIVKRTAFVFHKTISDPAALEVAKRSRQTPRIANRIFKRIRDFSDYEKKEYISLNDVKNWLKKLKIDDLGLDSVDNTYLESLVKRFNGGPVGLETLANSIGEEETNLEDIYEPYLIQLGFINRSNKGRIATDKAIKHVGKNK